MKPRQEIVLAALRRHIAEQGYPPSNSELAELVGLSTNRVRYWLITSERQGLLTHRRYSPRSWRPL